MHFEGSKEQSRVLMKQQASLLILTHAQQVKVEIFFTSMRRKEQAHGQKERSLHFNTGRRVNSFTK